jgi:hypothetical protein
MTTKYPIKYEIEPDTIDTGTHWVTLKLKNIGDKTLRYLKIYLNSMDSNNLSIIKNGEYVSELKPDEGEVLLFQVSAKRSTRICVSLSGRKDDLYYNWESPTFLIHVGKPKAEIHARIHWISNDSNKYMYSRNWNLNYMYKNNPKRMHH